MPPPTSSDPVSADPTDHRTAAPVSSSPESHADCEALGDIVDRVSNKWVVKVVGHLSSGPLRFNALMRALPGVSHRMLTLTLRGLQRDGLVLRTTYPTNPPQVDYALTELGRSLTGPLAGIAAWASERRTEIERARGAFDAEITPAPKA